MHSTTPRAWTKSRLWCARSSQPGMRCRSPARSRDAERAHSVHAQVQDMDQEMNNPADEMRARLEHLLECTRQIQARVEQGDWLGAAELDAERLHSLQE